MKYLSILILFMCLMSCNSTRNPDITNEELIKNGNIVIYIKYTYTTEKFVTETDVIERSTKVQFVERTTPLSEYIDGNIKQSHHQIAVLPP